MENLPGLSRRCELWRTLKVPSGVFNIFRAANLNINPKKCALLQKKMELTIRWWSCPPNKYELRGFLWIYYQRFVEHLRLHYPNLPNIRRHLHGSKCMGKPSGPWSQPYVVAQFCHILDHMDDSLSIRTPEKSGLELCYRIYKTRRKNNWIQQ